MLDKLKLEKILVRDAKNIVAHDTHALQGALTLWSRAAADTYLQKKLEPFKNSKAIPSWNGELGERVFCPNLQGHYCVIASDGSQIYPDKHAGTNCYLINTGVVCFDYLTPCSATIITEPFFYDDALTCHEYALTAYIDSKRQEHELQEGLRAVDTLQSNERVLFFTDGSLIFWNLEGKKQLKERFLGTYLAYYQEFYDRSVPVVGYVSAPNSKDIVTLLRAYATLNPGTEGDLATVLDRLVDAILFQELLQPGQRSQVFQSTVASIQEYPSLLRPFFFYLHTGDEVARVELPKWVVEDAELFAFVLTAIEDQIKKGGGYPISIAEAHNAAVVPQADKAYFYAALQRLTNSKGVSPSYKLRAKRRPAY